MEASAFSPVDYEIMTHPGQLCCLDPILRLIGTMGGILEMVPRLRDVIPNPALKERLGGFEYLC